MMPEVTPGTWIATRNTCPCHEDETITVKAVTGGNNNEIATHTYIAEFERAEDAVLCAKAPMMYFLLQQTSKFLAGMELEGEALNLSKDIEFCLTDSVPF